MGIGTTKVLHVLKFCGERELGEYKVEAHQFPENSNCTQ